MKLTLGTAQFGLRYGISNNNGLIKKSEINKILDFCLKNNILDIDTAKSYGHAEKKLGQYRKIKKFNINTKISDLDTLDKIQDIKKCINHSIKNLKILKINICYIHNFEDIKNVANGQKIFKELNRIKKEKKIKKIGISIYKISELNFCLKNYEFDAIQIPLNIINQDFNNNKILNKLKKRKIMIEIRSSCWQGIVFLNPKKIQSKFKYLKKKLIKLRQLEKSNDNILTYCIKFIKRNKVFKRAVVGITSLEELINITKSFNKKNYHRNNYSLFKSKSIMRDPSNW